MALSVPLSRFTSRVGGGSAFFVRPHYTFMKKLAIIGLSVAIVVACILLFWQHAKISKDRDFSQKLAGAWSWEWANIRETCDFAADGSFSYGLGKKSPPVAVQGTWLVKAGVLVMTFTNSYGAGNQGASVTGDVKRLKIIHLDAHRFKYVAGSTNTWTR